MPAIKFQYTLRSVFVLITAIAGLLALIIYCQKRYMERKIHLQIATSTPGTSQDQAELDISVKGDDAYSVDILLREDAQPSSRPTHIGKMNANKTTHDLRFKIRAFPDRIEFVCENGRHQQVSFSNIIPARFTRISFIPSPFTGQWLSRGSNFPVLEVIGITPDYRENVSYTVVVRPE